MPEPAVAAFKRVNELENSDSPVMSKMSEMEKRFADMERKFYQPATAPLTDAQLVPMSTAPPAASDVVQMQTSWDDSA